MKLALKIDVRTLRGAREGVPRLINALQRYNADASFLFNLGPDRSGRPLLHDRQIRATLTPHAGRQGWRYPFVHSGPHIGHRARRVLRRVRDEGFEVGAQSWDHWAWQRRAATADAEWTTRQMQLACGRFFEIFGELPRVHAAAGWQMNRHAYRLEQRMAFHYASDTRGICPFIPVYNGEPVACPQLPTTLPPFAEVLQASPGAPADVVDRLLALSADPLPTGHCYTAHAEIEGLACLTHFERLLEGWQALGYQLVSLQKLYESLDLRKLPHCLVEHDRVEGVAYPLALQARAFLA